MKTAPIAAATIAFDAEGVPQATAFGDRYHARAGAMAQAGHVFLGGNGLPRRWAARRRFVVLETGFGLGINFLATWAAWRSDPARPTWLHFVSVDKHPPSRADLARVHAALGHSGLPAELAGQLRDAWPPLTGDLHRLSFEHGRVQLLLAFGDAATWLRRLQLQADAIFLDGFAPELNPQMWSEALFAALPALCAADATAATWSAARAVRDGLAAQGFVVEQAPGFAGKREMTVARFAPHHRRAPHGRQQAALPGARRAIVVGAGLAGSTAAAALAEQGLEVSVLEAGPAVATGASGSSAGLVRALVARDDGPHARWHRAAALEAQQTIARLLEAGAVPGRLEGALHLGDDIADMQRRAAALALPPEHVRPLDREEASRRAAIPLASPAWFFPRGGWVDPAALAAHHLASDGVMWRPHSRVVVLQRRGNAWLALGERGEVLAEADLVLLANAADAARLAPAHAVSAWRIGRSRGQVTYLPGDALRATGQGPPLPPLLPLARNGYVIPLPAGALLCGATHSLDDDEAALRAADHEHNLGVLKRLAGIDLPQLDVSVLGGRVGWRCHTDDRLPLIGALPAQLGRSAGGARSGSRFAQPRHLPRESGLFTLTALGSRGITGAALGARVLAAWICDAPLPIDTDLLDAVDAARHASRAVARSARGTSGAGGAGGT